MLLLYSPCRFSGPTAQAEESPPVNTDFSRLKLAPELLTNLASLGYLQMTPIQAEALPPVLEGKDLSLIHI